MDVKEHSVRELHFTLDAIPKTVFKIQADTEERALRTLQSDLKKGMAELAARLKKLKEQKPTQNQNA